MRHRITITLIVDDCDPLNDDPHDIADYLLDLNNEERSVGNPSYALRLIEAEWT